MKSMTIPVAIILAAGLAFGGMMIGDGFVKSRKTDRFVTVKGISERDVLADKALWPVRFVASANDLKQAQRSIEASRQEILKFLQKYGIEESQVELQSLEVNDVLANPYHSGQVHNRYIITQTVMVRSDDPDLIRVASQRVSELVDAGVVLSAGGYPASNPTYLFTLLNDVKPDMIAEATANARAAAEQFARDSGSHLGGIRTANQGLFVILARDRAPGVTEENQPNKTVRVVSTVEYYLED